MTLREIDALVAEKVMGWVWIRELEHYAPSRGREWHKELCQAAPIPNLSDERDWLSVHLEESRSKDPDCLSSIPRFSANIAAAWEVVEKIKEQGDVFIEWWSDDEWLVSKYPVIIRQADGSRDAVVAPTAPMAICLAALRMVGVTDVEVSA